ncbi:MAG: DUF4430 domain-containing protein, partial [Lysinibacillus sp.]
MKKWLQLALVFILTLSLVAPAAVQAEGQSNYITTTELASEPTDTALTEPKCTTVQVRVESWLETLIPLQELCVEAFDDSNLGLTKEEPVVGHVLLAALDNAVDKKVTRADAVITGGGYGMYLKSIGKYGEFSMGTQMDGWMYKKNFSWANGMSIEPMESGDRYDIYYVGNYGEVSFTEMTATKQVITRGDTTVVTLIDKDTQQPVADATIYIDGQASTIKTDAKGQATISFDSVGQHEISAEKYREDPANMEDNNNIIRPVPVTIEVTEVVNVSAKEVSPTIAEAIANASAYMSKDEPKFGSEWKVLALARGNYAVQEGYFDTYYNNVVKHLQDKGGVLAGNHTEYSRLIIALTAIGKDPRNVGGYNLLEKLSDYKKVVGQGINGATFGLIALDTHRYEIPQVAGVETITTREKLIGEISGKEIPGGGFAFFGTKPDPDMTGMAIQALAPYKNQPEVRAIIDRAIVIMDKLQLSNGGYNSWGENVQSPAQILTALSALGIDAKTDERFIQDDGSWIVSAMMDYYDKPTGAFKQGGKPNGMATEQATYGLVAYKRFLDNKSSLYDMTDVVLSTPPPAIPTTKQAYGTVGQYMVSKVPNPKFLDEWEIITLSRGGYAVPANYYEAYYNNVVQHVKDVKGVLHKVKYTEYSRLIMALTAIGKDPTNVGGYNLLEKLADYNLVIKQGINGAIFGLIALDTKAYKIPELAVENVTTREKLIQHILDKEIAGGGFALSGKNPDPDITAMAIQALSKYQGNTKTAGEVSAETMAKVKAATDRAITVLANLQTAEGGYQSWGTANSESASQVVTALASLGIDANVDSRFNKVLGNIMTFYSETDGGFKHVISEKQANGMATQQAGYTLAAHQRVVDGKPGLYDMSDVVSGESPDPGEKPDPPTNPGEGDGGTTTPPTNPEPPVETKKTVNMSIVISSSEVPLPSSQIEVKTGETALDVLKRATTLNGIALKVRDTNYGLYVEGINGLSEFDRGPLSGWMYRVNGVFPNMSAGYFTVKAGDRIEWLYTTNLGE